MTTTVDIANKALIALGIQKKISTLGQDSVEAQTLNALIFQLRDDLLRMAPWNCGLKTANLSYITSTPGTPENTSPATLLWAPGQPAPPWAYEYQYPVDCLRPCWIVPAFTTGFTGVPITTAVTGGSPNSWTGDPIKFKVAIDQFHPVTAAAVVAGGTGYAVGDQITLALGVVSSPPIGGPVVLQVLTVGAGVVTSVVPVNQIQGSASPQGGSYFAVQSGTIAQGSTTGAGTGATFTLTQGAAGDQRVILTNQEYATMSYVRQVTDPNVMDPLFIDAWTAILAARASPTLKADPSFANMKIAESNSYIVEARKADGNEGLTVNNVTPDWLRIRGINFVDSGWGPNQFDWGALWSPMY